MIWVLLLLILNTGNILSVFSNDDDNYFAETQKPNYDNFLCNNSLVIHQKRIICEEIFKRYQSGVWEIVYINKQAYDNIGRFSSLCTKRYINLNLTDRYRYQKSMLLICYGQHKPIKTIYNIDDYYRSFYLSTGIDPKHIFVFKHIKTDVKNKIILLGKINLDIDITLIESKFISSNEIKEDAFLNTVETKNYNKIDVEAIFVAEMKPIQDIQFKNPLYTLDKEHLLTVCLSVFSDILDIQYNALIDRYGMLTANNLEKQQELILEYTKRTKRRQFPQNTYSCLAKQKTGTEIKDNFYLSPGWRPNSIFAYSCKGGAQYIHLIFYVQNFNFDNLRLSTLSETEDRINLKRPMDSSESLGRPSTFHRP